MIDNDPEGYRQAVLDSLRKFHASEPKFPADPVEQRRRFDLLQTDPICLQLKENRGVATGQARLNISRKLRDRRWNIMTSPDPESLIAQAQQGQNQ